LPALRRFIPLGSYSRPIRPRLVSILSRLRQPSTGIGPPCRCSRLVSVAAELPGAGVQVSFPLVELGLAATRGPIPGIGHAIPLISDLIPPISNEIALVSGPCSLLLVA